MAVLVLVALLVALLGQLVTTQECMNDEIRTVRSGDNDFIQYCVRGQWRLHCTGENIWRFEESNVACRQLGYDGAVGPDAPRASDPGTASTGSFFRFPGQCDGTESSVQECGSGSVMELGSCTLQHGITRCQSATCNDQDIRLVGGSTNREGRVEVCMDGRWGTVCNTDQEGLAEVVCGQQECLQCGTTLATFPPSTPPRYMCMQQSESDSLHCINGSCDLSPSLGVMCRSYEDLTVSELRNCETERNQLIIELNDNITTLNETLQQCMDNSIETEISLQNNITAISNTLNQCMTDATKTDMIFQSLKVNETKTRRELQQCLANAGETLASSTANTPALGAVIGVLVVLLMTAVVGWILTCIKLARSGPSKKSTAGVHKMEHYSLQEAVYDDATSKQDNYSSLGPNYGVVTDNKEDLDTYDVIDHNKQALTTVQPKPAILTPEGASKKGDDFYDADEHTYAMVDKKAKRKAPQNVEMEEDPHIYDMAISGETSRGVQEGQDGYSKLKR